MKIVVFVKQVPDSTARVEVVDGKVTWGEAPLVINPWDEIAVEAALLQKEAFDGDVIAVSLGVEDTSVALRHALAMGCSEAIMITDPALLKADSQAVAHVMAAALQKIGDVDLAIFGRQAIDSDTGVTAAQAARMMGWPMLSLVSAIRKFDPAAGVIQVECSIEEGRQVVEASTPAVLNMSKDFGEPRYPSFMGMRKASKAEIPTWTLSDLGQNGLSPLVSWVEVVTAPKREVQTEMISGQDPREIANNLVEKIIAEEVL